MDSQANVRLTAVGSLREFWSIPPQCEHAAFNLANTKFNGYSAPLVPILNLARFRICLLGQVAVNLCHVPPEIVERFAKGSQSENRIVRPELMRRHRFQRIEQALCDGIVILHREIQVAESAVMEDATHFLSELFSRISERQYLVVDTRTRHAFSFAHSLKCDAGLPFAEEVRQKDCCNRANRLDPRRPFPSVKSAGSADYYEGSQRCGNSKNHNKKFGVHKGRWISCHFGIVA